MIISVSAMRIEHLNLIDINFTLTTILRHVMECQLNAVKIITFNLDKIKMHYKNLVKNKRSLNKGQVPISI